MNRRSLLCDAAESPGGWTLAYLASADPEAWWGRSEVSECDSVSAELQAILFTCRIALAHPERFPEGITILNDCKPAVQAVSRKAGPRREDLRALAAHFHRLCAQSGLQVKVFWVGRARTRPAHLLAKTMSLSRKTSEELSSRSSNQACALSPYFRRLGRPEGEDRAGVELPAPDVLLASLRVPGQTLPEPAILRSEGGSELTLGGSVPHPTQSPALRV